MSEANFHTITGEDWRRSLALARLRRQGAMARLLDQIRINPNESQNLDSAEKKSHSIHHFPLYVNEDSGDTLSCQ